MRLTSTAWFKLCPLMTHLGNLNIYHVWMPLGRAITLADAETAAIDDSELTEFIDRLQNGD